VVKRAPAAAGTGSKRAAAKRAAKSPAARKASRYTDALLELAAAREDCNLTIDGVQLALTNLNKVLWPADKTAALPAYSRRDHLRYLLRAGPHMLPHLRDRPLTLIRMPEGIQRQRFVQFHWEQRLPSFVESLMIYSARSKVSESFLVCNNMPTLLWLAHVGTLEMHVWHSRANTAPDAPAMSDDYASSVAALEGSILNYPDYIVFDIDPYVYSGAEAKGSQPEFNVGAFEQAKEVALWLKELLDSMKVDALVKTSGKTGLHVLVPIQRTVAFDAARAFAETVGRHLMQQHPNVITMDWNVKKRTGKIFIDYNMNVRVKTLSAPYSVRGLPGAPVSMPLSWKELAAAHPLDYTLANVADVLERRGDIWCDLIDRKQDIARVLAAG
jgi:bifunctional non-homologous end joining protein LigD